MALKYDEAVQVWAKQKVAERGRDVEGDTFSVDIEVDEGYACCGGRDPDCYCSFAESPSAYIGITVKSADRKFYKEYELKYVGFEEALREIIVAGGGSIDV